MAELVLHNGAIDEILVRPLGILLSVDDLAIEVIAACSGPRTTKNSAPRSPVPCPPTVTCARAPMRI